ncbi:formylglycine-generating enzyme family protein [Paracoccus yeei]|uniref:formylglycine-generating enzyme family protein n=1 Tax=Paracoccus yeei TaxID=147645 RepID=UPI0039EFAF1A
MAGAFPNENLAPDGRERASPVTAFPPNGHGIHDMIGTVWEWTRDFYAASHPADAAKGLLHPAESAWWPGRDKHDPPRVRNPRRVIKGGSHLCAPSHCRRYRPDARHAGAVDTSTSYLGFRCVWREGQGAGAYHGAPLGPVGPQPPPPPALLVGLRLARWVRFLIGRRRRPCRRRHDVNYPSDCVDVLTMDAGQTVVRPW